MKTYSAALISASILGLASAQAATLKVDFSDSIADVDSAFAGYIVANSTVPTAQTYTSGSQGYIGTIDTGAGVTVSLGSADDTAWRTIDRGGDLYLRDYISLNLGFEDNQDIRLSGLSAVTGTFIASLEDIASTGIQIGVLDVQLSVDGGQGDCLASLFWVGGCSFDDF